MIHALHSRLAALVDEWREQGYPSDYPSLTATLHYAGGEDDGVVPYLRRAQLRALETYWYLRVVKKTPLILDLYRDVFKGGRADLVDGLGIDNELFKLADYDLERTLKMVREDDAVVKRFHLETLREALSLDYPSYILALAMGAGKTVLIGAIIATEFTQAVEHPDGPFLQNALVFAPGKEILESLRELTRIPYERILPPRLHKLFLSHMRLVFTRDGEKFIQVVPGSAFNIVVTNTEKIRIQKEKVRKSTVGKFRFDKDRAKAKEDIANARLLTIASLQSLGVFSNEARYNTGHRLGAALKEVRKTVDLLHENTGVACVINTTGTPHLQRQPLRETVVWDGISERATGGILKRVPSNIEACNFDGTHADQFIARVVEDFFENYGDVRLPDGSPAKLVICFPQTGELDKLRPAVEAKLAEIGRPPSICLSNTPKSSTEEKEAFNRLSAPRSPHRVILLANTGSDGWNCPSLFACALARGHKPSNRFPLQATSGCLREMPGKCAPTKTYLSERSISALKRRSRSSRRETPRAIRGPGPKIRRCRVVVRKPNVAPLMFTKPKRMYVRKKGVADKLVLSRPAFAERSRATKAAPDDLAMHGRAPNAGAAKKPDRQAAELDLCAVSVELASLYRLDYWLVHDQLVALYPARRVPPPHMSALAKQIEDQTCIYDAKEVREEQALAFVRPEGFIGTEHGSGRPLCTVEVRRPAYREDLLLSLEQTATYNPDAISFHYDPYIFDSARQRDYLEKVLRHHRQHPTYVDDVFYTGGMADPAKTDIFFEYKGEDGRWRFCAPDFVIRRKDGKCLIVEIKPEQSRAAVEEDLRRLDEDRAPIHQEGRKSAALLRWARLDSSKLKHELVFASDSKIPPARMKGTFRFMGAPRLAKWMPS